MHEFAIAEHLFQIVNDSAKKAKAERVVSVQLSLGVRSHVDLESLKSYYDFLSKGSLGEGAILQANTRAMTFFCDSCQQFYETVDADFTCPACKAYGTLENAGDELLIKSIEVEP